MKDVTPQENDAEAPVDTDIAQDAGDQVVVPEATVKATTTEPVETTSDVAETVDPANYAVYAASLFTVPSLYSEGLLKQIGEFVGVGGDELSAAVVKDVINYINQAGEYSPSSPQAPALHSQLINTIAGLFFAKNSRWKDCVYLLLDLIGENIQAGGAFSADRVHRYNNTAFGPSIRIDAVNFVEYICAIAPKKTRLVTMRQLDISVAAAYLTRIFGDGESGQAVVNTFTTTFRRQ